jgi:hypothetical protein
MKIIFLDIDGPIISSGCYGIDHMCSMRRTVMNTNAIGYLNLLCKFTDAKIVTNSSHNYHDTPRYGIDSDSLEPVVQSHNNLMQDLIQHGVKKEYFHEKWVSKYPYISSKMDYDNHNYSDLNRLVAINDWIKENGECDWVCFDDIKFTDLENLIVVDFEHGITFDNANKAYKMLNSTNLDMPIVR